MAKNRQKHTENIITKSQIDELLTIVAELETTGQSVLLATLNTELTEVKKRAALNQITQSVIITDGKVKQWLIPAISGSYIAGVNALDNEVKKFGIKTAIGNITVETLKGVVEMQPHLAAVNALMSDAYLDFGSGMTGYIKGAEHALNDALKRQVQSKLAVGRLKGEGIREIKKSISQELSDRGFTVLIDRGGNQWSLGQYSEMLARTHVIKANTEATINRGVELEIDVYEVSSHGATDILCSSQEGKLYSFSGNNKKYPALSGNRPPFHPNCKHTLLPRPDLQS